MFKYVGEVTHRKGNIKYSLVNVSRVSSGKFWSTVLFILVCSGVLFFNCFIVCFMSCIVILVVT